MSAGRGAEGGRTLRLALCGDVMTGRGIDQVLPHPSAPQLHEPYVDSALDYVTLAERAHGAIPRPVDFAYVWGDLLHVLDRARPDVRLVNLETSVTTSEDRDPKGINYRMNPKNVPCLGAARLDCCGLANNHVLDWGPAGLVETLEVLARAGMATAGAGREAAEAGRPAMVEARGGRVLVFAVGSESSGIPPDWAATADRPGVALLPDLSPGTVARLAERIAAVRRAGDIVVVSIHWGANWGYEVPRTQRAFARGLVERAGVDVVHGHSSHHPKGFEVHEGRPILYGCGDFLNDYEGISGYEEFRDDLVLLYLLDVEVASGRLAALSMVPFHLRRFRLGRATQEEAAWLGATLDRECAAFGVRVELDTDGHLSARWNGDG